MLAPINYGQEVCDCDTPSHTGGTLPRLLAPTMMNNVVNHGHNVCETEDDDVILPDLNSRVSSSWRHRLDRCIRDNKVLCVAISVTLTSLVLTLVFMQIMLSILKDRIRQDLILRETTSSRWTKPNVDAYLSLYQFLWNFHDAPVSVSDSEPHVFRMHFQKVNVTWNNNSSVSYQDQIFLFDNTSSPHADRLHKLLPAFIRNGTPGHMLNVFTGESNFNLAYQTFSWNYSRNLPFWKSDDANEIHGTDGSVFQPFLDKATPLTLFYPLLNRKFDLEYSGPATFKNLPVYRFIIPDSQFFNATSMSDRTGRAHPNQGWAHRSADGSCAPDCLPNGAYPILSGLPGHCLFITLPHLLGADPYYHQEVLGLDPDPSRHRPFFDVDKVTGITVRQKRRFQVNGRSTHGRHTNMSTFIPAYWFEMSIEVSDDILSYIERTNRSFTLVYSSCTCVGVVLCLLLAALSSLLVYKILTKRAGTSLYARLTVLPGCTCCKSI